MGQAFLPRVLSDIIGLRTVSVLEAMLRVL
jgi:hypothetical protein